MKRRKRVLVVDDDAAVVLSLARALYQDNEEYDVLLARNGEIAQQIMREIPIQVLVTDIHLPGLSGMDLIYWVAAERPETRVAVITAQEIATLREKAYQQGVLHVVPKPLDLPQVRELIRSLLDERGGLSGDLARLSVVDVIQMLCLGRQTTSLQLGGGAGGVVLIERGQVVHAVWGDQQGEAAFYRIVRERQGHFQTVPFPADVPRTIQEDWQHLLMEGARLEDEAARQAGGAPPGDEPEVDLSALEFPPVAAPVPPGASSAMRLPTPTLSTPARVHRGVPLELLTPAASSGSGFRLGSSASGVKSGVTARVVTDAAARAPLSEADRAEVERLVQLGFELLRRADYPAARETWLTAERMDPENHLVKVNLRKLERLAQGR